MNFKRQFQWLAVIGFTSILGCEGGATEDAQVPSGDREEIQSMHDSRTLHYNNRNLDALMATYSVEAVVLTGTLQVASGANAIRELIGDEMAQSTSLRNDLKEVLLFDDRAVLWGEYTWSGTSPENSLELNTSGPYMLELSEEDGVWKVSREMWTQIEELGEGTAWGIIPQDFEESSEWGDEIDLLANLYNRGNPAALAEFFSEDARVGLPNAPVLQGRENLESFFARTMSSEPKTTMDVSVRSANILHEENVVLVGYMKIDGLGQPVQESSSRFLVLLELANPFEVDAGEDAEWQIRWMIGSGRRLFGT